MAATSSLEVDPTTRDSKSRKTLNKSPQSATRMDRQLERISKILHNSVEEFAKNEKTKNKPTSVFGRELLSYIFLHNF